MKISIDPTDFFFEVRYLLYKKDRARCAKHILKHVFWMIFFYWVTGAALYTYLDTNGKSYLFVAVFSIGVVLYCFNEACKAVVDLIHYRDMFVLEFKLFLERRLKRKTATR
jgi:hypothetical protein